MILYFITGFISGVIGTLMFGKWASMKVKEIDKVERQDTP